MPLITVAQADAHLRLSLEHDDGSPLTYTDDRLPDLQLKMLQAEAIVLDYLKVAVEDPMGTSPPLWSGRHAAVVQAAVLLVLSALYDDEIERTLGDYLKDDGVISRLLTRLRDPALA
jgi:hypothetical protein